MGKYCSIALNNVINMVVDYGISVKHPFTIDKIGGSTVTKKIREECLELF